MGFDEGPAGLTKLVRSVVGVYGRKGLLGPAREALGRDGDALPTIELIPAPPALGRGALDAAIHFDVPGKRASHTRPGKKKAGGITLHVLLMGEPRSTWIAVGADRDELTRRLLGARTGAPEAGTLAARPGLDPLRSGKVVSGGFLSVGMVTRGLARMLGVPVIPASSRASGPLAELTRTLDDLPHRGDTPIFYASTARAAAPGGPAGPRSAFVFDMPKGSLEDVGAILLTLDHIATKKGLFHP